jgi:hypothetical protein
MSLWHQPRPVGHRRHHPALAAAEVAYAYQPIGSSLISTEIGNQPDLFDNTGGYYAGN